MKQLLDYLQKHETDMVKTLEELVSIESFTREKDGVDKVGNYMIHRLEALGASVEILPQDGLGDHVMASWGRGLGQVLIMCHMDTVWPSGTIRERPFRVKDSRAFGPGVLDMKAGMVITIHALQALRDLELTPPLKIRMLFTSDEEIGSPTSKHLIMDEGRVSSHVFCMEPSYGKEGALKTERKGVGMFDIKVIGRAAHAGNDPQNGVSAIQELSQQVLMLHSLNNLETGTTVNVGVVEGGTVRNQIAPEARALVDIRVATPSEGTRISSIINGLSPIHPEAHIEVIGGMNRQPLERTPQIAALFNDASDLATPLGIELLEARVGGGSDAQFIAEVGIPVLDGLGGVGEGPHADHEYVFLQSITQRTALMVSLLMNLKARR